MKTILLRSTVVFLVISSFGLCYACDEKPLMEFESFGKVAMEGIVKFDGIPVPQSTSIEALKDRKSEFSKGMQRCSEHYTQHSMRGKVISE